ASALAAAGNGRGTRAEAYDFGRPPSSLALLPDGRRGRTRKPVSFASTFTTTAAAVRHCMNQPWLTTSDWNFGKVQLGIRLNKNQLAAADSDCGGGIAASPTTPAITSAYWAFARSRLSASRRARASSVEMSSGQP